MLDANLKAYEKNGIELVINLDTGEAFATAKGYSRMASIPYSTVKNRVQKGDGTDDIQTALIPTLKGLQQGRLIPAKTIFKWALKDNQELALAMGTAGATVYLHQLAGYQFKSIITTHLPTVAETLLETAKILVQQEQMIADLTTTVTNLYLRLNKLETQADKTREGILKAFTEGLESKETTAIVKVNARKDFADVNELVRSFCLRYDQSYRNTWNKVYSEFKYRYSIDLKVRGKNRTPQISGVKIATELGLLAELYSVAQIVIADLEDNLSQ